MLRLRSIFFVLTLLLVVPLLGAMAVAAYVLWDIPPPQGPRIRAPHEVVGVHTRGATQWVVPAGDDAVVLVDAGLEPEAEALKAEIRDRQVLGILVTHGHLEQIVGLEAFPGVPVYLGEADQGLLSGEDIPEGWLARWFAEVLELPAQHGEVHPVEDGQVLELGTETFRAVHTPGHTDGHVVWAWRDVIFTGGALLAGSPLRTMPGPLSNDPELALRSLDALLPLDFEVIADGHSGFVTNGRAELHRFLDATLEAPTITLLGPQVPGPDAGPTVSQEGLLVRAPEADGATLLVLDDGPQWVLELGEVDASPFDGQRVTVTGTLTAPEARPGLPGRLWLDVDGIQPTEPPRPGDPPAPTGLPVLTSREEASNALHRWAVVRGTVASLTPLARGAAFGEGRIALAEGEEVPLSAPMTTPVGSEIELLVRVSQEGGALWLAARRACSESMPCL